MRNTNIEIRKNGKTLEVSGPLSLKVGGNDCFSSPHTFSLQPIALVFHWNPGILGHWDPAFPSASSEAIL